MPKPHHKKMFGFAPRPLRVFMEDSVLRETLSVYKGRNLKEGLNNKKFHIKDTGLSYRQIAELDKGGMLGQARRESGSWRSFSLKELVYLKLIEELRKYGIQNSALSNVREAFFKKPFLEDVRNVDAPLSTAEMMIVHFFLESLVLVAINSDGDVAFFDRFHAPLTSTLESCLLINFNELTHTVMKAHGWTEPLKYRTSDFPTDESVAGSDISSVEMELLRTVRDGAYRQIEITMKDGRPALMRVRKPDLAGLHDEAELLKIIRDKSFATFNVTKRDGKVQSFQEEDTIKL